MGFGLFAGAAVALMLNLALGCLDEWILEAKRRSGRKGGSVEHACQKY